MSGRAFASLSKLVTAFFGYMYISADMWYMNMWAHEARAHADLAWDGTMVRGFGCCECYFRFFVTAYTTVSDRVYISYHATYQYSRMCQ